jgi:hypothetical protein
MTDVGKIEQLTTVVSPSYEELEAKVLYLENQLEVALLHRINKHEARWKWLMGNKRYVIGWVSGSWYVYDCDEILPDFSGDTPQEAIDKAMQAEQDGE